MALSWGARRQLVIVGGFIAAIVLVAAAIIIPKLHTTPTCFDGKKDGNELGVDCGGACTKLCSFQTADVVVKWARVFPVTSSVANAVAYISNPNPNAAAENVPYTFKIYDADWQFITERDGSTYIAPNGNSAIFEGGIKVGSRVPAHVEFQFTGAPLWVATDPRLSQLQIVPSNAVLTNSDTKPVLSGVLSNTSQLYGVQNISVVGILYDANQNAVGVSQTLVQSLAPGQGADVYFTWPTPFATAPVRNEILPRFDPFAVQF